ncbi:MAG: DUF3570 domain-containing protein [Sandaracinaceae bacterium]
MRLQLTLSLRPAPPLALVTLAAMASACGGSSPPPSGAVVADLRTSVYQDTDRTTIGSGAVAVRARPNTEVTIGAHYLVDITTSASVDVVSAATGRWDEARNEGAGDVSWTDGWTGLSAGYVYSRENDWESHTGSAGFTQDFDDHNLTLGIGGGFVWNNIWRASDNFFQENQWSASGSLSLVGVASPTEIWQVVYNFSYVDGYQASPYRFARLADGANVPVLLFLPERHPRQRMRHALVIRQNTMLSDDVALRSHARAYLDDWGIGSVTIGTELRAAVGDGWELGAMVRGYGQLGASFYQDIYAQPMRYMTSDRELSPFLDAFAGPRLAWRGQNQGAFRELRFEVKLLGFAFYFPDFSRLETRYGFVGELAFGGNL